HVMEAVRLADTLAAVRQKQRPGLAELYDATLSVFCMGYDAPMRLIEERIVVGNKVGQTPADAPAHPLQVDFDQTLKALRWTKTLEKSWVEAQEIKLDLREELDLNRSRLLHRLRLMDIDWGRPQAGSSKAQGTF